MKNISKYQFLSYFNIVTNKQTKRKLLKRGLAIEQICPHSRVLHILNPFYKIHSSFSTIFTWLKVLIILKALLLPKWKLIALPQISDGYQGIKQTFGKIWPIGHIFTTPTHEQGDAFKDITIKGQRKSENWWHSHKILHIGKQKNKW